MILKGDKDDELKEGLQELEETVKENFSSISHQFVSVYILPRVMPHSYGATGMIPLNVA